MGLSSRDRRAIPLPPVSRPPISPLTEGEPAKKPPRISEKVKAAIAHLLSANRPDIAAAAAAAGMRDAHALREQLKFEHVRRYLFAERRALVAAACAGNPAALMQVRDKGENAMASVQAAKALEQLRIEADQEHRGSAGAITRPGLIIVVQQPSPAGAAHNGPTITIEPQSAAPVEDADWEPGQSAAVEMGEIGEMASRMRLTAIMGQTIELDPEPEPYACLAALAAASVFLL